LSLGAHSRGPDRNDDVKRASETLETQSQQLGSQVTQFLGKIRAA
jgi:hypothetical protein